jgi:hypothetical protein
LNAPRSSRFQSITRPEPSHAPVRLMPPLRWRRVQIRFRRTRRDRVLAVLAYRYSQGVRRLRRD